MELGRIKEIDVRRVWAHEQYDFSAWLAKEENIKLLGDELNLSLVDIETEKFVGAYRCDILCKDEFSGKTVLIENQLEQTNHDHLGKIITYASGLDAGVVVWIVSSVREEHSSAVQWLNKHTDEELDFFLIEVHAYTIGDSVPAPLFKIIEQPNDFAKRAKILAKTSGLNEASAKYMEFWSTFNDMLEQRNKPFPKRKASTASYYNVSMGSTKCNIAIDLINAEHKVRVGLFIADDKNLFDELFANKESIERQANTAFHWKRMDNKKAARIYTHVNGLNFNDHSNYTELINEIIETVLMVKRVFLPYI